MAELPTKEQLAELPCRAIVAYAVRNARRVQPLYRPRPDTPDRLNHLRAVDHAIDLAERFAAGENIDGATLRAAADEAFKAADAAADNDAQTVAAIAGFSVDVDVDAVAVAVAAADVYAVTPTAQNDYQSIQHYLRSGGNYSTTHLEPSAVVSVLTASPPIVVDPRPTGPLGPLWPNGEPEWYRVALATHQALWKELEAVETPETQPVKIEEERLVLGAEIGEYVDPEEAVEALAALHQAMSEFHIAHGGNGLIIDEWRLYAPILAPAGVES